VSDDRGAPLFETGGNVTGFSDWHADLCGSATRETRAEGPGSKADMPFCSANVCF
jgi:hypothetical protein